MRKINKLGKRAAALVLAVGLTLSTAAPVLAADADEVQTPAAQTEQQETDTAPMLVNERTYVARYRSDVFITVCYNRRRTFSAWKIEIQNAIDCLNIYVLIARCCRYFRYCNVIRYVLQRDFC